MGYTNNQRYMINGITRLCMEFAKHSDDEEFTVADIIETANQLTAAIEQTSDEHLLDFLYPSEEQRECERLKWRYFNFYDIFEKTTDEDLQWYLRRQMASIEGTMLRLCGVSAVNEMRASLGLDAYAEQGYIRFFFVVLNTKQVGVLLTEREPNGESAARR